LPANSTCKVYKTDAKEEEENDDDDDDDDEGLMKNRF
jgi:hypothetical protein